MCGLPRNFKRLLILRCRVPARMRMEYVSLPSWVYTQLLEMKFMGAHLED